MLGAAAQATRHIPLMTYVTCPIRRYHPAVVAQKAATMPLLSDGRFSLGLGAGENLNEHIVGGQWPLVPVRYEMPTEAVEITRALWAGGTVTYRGQAFRCRVREGLTPAGRCPADRHRGIGPEAVALHQAVAQTAAVTTRALVAATDECAPNAAFEQTVVNAWPG
jgi:G6PDH family F420-dependent oxidoreductase